MGSRRGRYAALIFLGACSVGAPPGFSVGTSWTAPLIGPLENGELLVPVFVNGAGPYIFAIDPDAPVSIVEDHVVKEAKLIVDTGGRMLDESDTSRPRFYAETLGIEIGSLTVERRDTEIVTDHVYDLDGRQIDGVIGHDIVSDSVAFEFDRDRGLVTVMTSTDAAAAVPGFGGQAVPWKKLTAQMKSIHTQPIARRLVDAQIDGATYTLHVDFGAPASQLQERAWPTAKLAIAERHGTVTDEVGVPRSIDKVGTAETVTVGATTAHRVEFIPFRDKRWHDEDFEGTLGLDFFRDQTVLVDLDHDTYYTKPRGDLAATTAARIARWQTLLLPACTHVGCASVNVIDPLAAMPAETRPAQHPGVVISVVRDPAAAHLPLEVVLSVTAPGADPRRLVANLPASVDRAMTHLPSGYVGATVTVIDASPFPRACPTSDGCVDELR